MRCLSIEDIPFSHQDEGKERTKNKRELGKGKTRGEKSVFFTIRQQKDNGGKREIIYFHLKTYLPYLFENKCPGFNVIQ